jgi:myo-inositol-1(or 4)-monophosphatase
VWVIDPVDGTNNFVAGLRAFCVCIGLLEAGRPLMGVVFDVCQDQVYAAARGEGAWLDNRRLQAAQTPMSESSLLMITSNILDKNKRVPAYLVRWFGQSDWKLRILGSAALEAVSVAAGVAHGAITVNGKLWDVAAPAAILEEAGAVLTSPKGEPIFPFELNNYKGAKVPFLAAGPKAHPELLREIRSYA